MRHLGTASILTVSVVAVLAIAQVGDAALGRSAIPVVVGGDTGRGLRCRGCNVLLISIDTLRGDHVGVNGYPRPTTPRLDEFAGDAVNFRVAIAQAASTLPSHAAMFTSLIPEHHGAMHSRNQPLSDDATTMAELLAAEGYTTVAFTAGAQLAPAWNLDQGFDRYEADSGSETHQSTFADKVDAATGWLERNPDAKFFMFLHTYEVHAPYTPEPRYMELFDAGYDGPMEDEITVDELRQINMNFRHINDADLRHIVSAYDAEIRSVDAAFGRLVDHLETAGLYDDTMVIFTSDHGEEFGEHGSVGWHAITLYDELLRIPLVMKLPRSAYAGTEVRSQVTTLDLLPTMLDVLDIPGAVTGAHAFEGTSLVDAIRDGSGATFAVSQRDKEEDPLPTAIRTLRWKLVDGVLYDLAADPGERLDVSERHPTVKAALERSLEEIRARPGLDPAEAIELDDELARQLRALGYIR